MAFSLVFILNLKPIVGKKHEKIQIKEQMVTETDLCRRIKIHFNIHLIQSVMKNLCERISIE
jgi:hypothetical protein